MLSSAPFAGSELAGAAGEERRQRGEAAGDCERPNHLEEADDPGDADAERRPLNPPVAGRGHEVDGEQNANQPLQNPPTLLLLIPPPPPPSGLFSLVTFPFTSSSVFDLFFLFLPPLSFRGGGVVVSGLLRLPGASAPPAVLFLLPDQGARRRPSQPHTFYIGVVNGGVWKTTDAGRTWPPIFDDQPTGSIGAIAVAPSDPDVIYVGTGEGQQRPDLATGDGIYKSTDGGRTWTHLGLRDAQQIAQIIVDPRTPESAVRRGARPSLRPERGARHLPIDRRRADVSRRCSTRTRTPAASTSRSIRRTRTSSTPRSGRRGRDRGRTATSAARAAGLFKSTDGGTTWRPLTTGLPTAGRRSARAHRHHASRRAVRRVLRRGRARPAAAVSIDRTTPGETWTRVNARSRASSPGDFTEVASTRRIPTSSTCRPSWRGSRPTAARRSPRFAARPAATTTTIWINPTIPTSSS